MAAVLTSWKEISAHLGKSIRTVQRWERELGLPVRRPDLRRSGIVLADPAELDSWLHQQHTFTTTADGPPQQNGKGVSTLQHESARTRELADRMKSRIAALQQTAELNRQICQALQDHRLRRQASRSAALPA
jgi:hypothetical protein